MTDEEAFRALVGSWRMVACLARHRDGSESKPIGSDARGILIYSADGDMSSHTVAGGSADPGMLPYHGYYGEFAVDAARGIVTHYVIGGSAPEMAGTEQPRRFELAGDRLVLQADRGDWTAHVVWERHNPA